MRKAIAAFIICLIASSFCLAQNTKSTNKDKVKIQLVARYYDNGFFDISSDGKLLLLYGPSTPNKEKSGGVTEWKPRKEERYSHKLRVVEWESGRELGNVPENIRGTLQRPDDALFIAGTNQVCFRDEEAKRWDYVSGKIGSCAVFPMPYHHIPLSFYEKRESSNKGKYEAKVSIKKGANLLVVKYRSGVVTIYDLASGEELGKAVHPTEKWWAEYPTAGMIYGIALTRDGRYLLTYYADDTFIWRMGA